MRRELSHSLLDGTGGSGMTNRNCLTVPSLRQLGLKPPMTIPTLNWDKEKADVASLVAFRFEVRQRVA